MRNTKTLFKERTNMNWIEQNLNKFSPKVHCIWALSSSLYPYKIHIFLIWKFRTISRKFVHKIIYHHHLSPIIPKYNQLITSSTKSFQYYCHKNFDNLDLYLNILTLRSTLINLRYSNYKQFLSKFHVLFNQFQVYHSNIRRT